MTAKPIYLWSQALDNKQDDDFYKIVDGVALPIDDISFVQAKVVEIGDIVEHSTRSGFRLDKQLQSLLMTRFPNLKVYYKGDSILLKFKTSDVDVLGRPSNIDVVLSRSSITDGNVQQYILDFYNGFRDFCHKTGRNIDDLEGIKSVEFLKLVRLDASQSVLGLPADFLRNNLNYVAVALAVIAIVMIVYKII